MKPGGQLRKEILCQYFHSLLSVIKLNSPGSGDIPGCFSYDNIDWKALLLASSLIVQRTDYDETLTVEPRKIVVQDIKGMLDLSEEQASDLFLHEEDSCIQYKLGVILITQGLISSASETFIQAAISLSEKFQIELQCLIEETQRLVKIGNIGEVESFFNSDSLIDTETSLAMARTQTETLSPNESALREKDTVIRGLNAKVQELEHLLMLAQRDHREAQQQYLEQKEQLSRASEELRQTRSLLTDEEVLKSEMEHLRAQLVASKTHAEQLTQKIQDLQSLEHEHYELLESKLELEGTVDSLMGELKRLRELKHVKTRADQQNDLIALMTSQLEDLKMEIGKLREASHRKDRTIQELLEHNERLRDMPSSKSMEFDEVYGERLVLYSGLQRKPPSQSRTTQVEPRICLSCSTQTDVVNESHPAAFSCQAAPRVLHRDCQTEDLSEDETDLLTEIQNAMNAETHLLQLELDETRKSLTDEIVQLNHVIRSQKGSLEELRGELVKLRSYSRVLEEQLRFTLHDIHSSSASREEATPTKGTKLQELASSSESPHRENQLSSRTDPSSGDSTPREDGRYRSGLVEKLREDKAVLQITLYRLVKFIKRYFAARKVEDAAASLSSLSESSKLEKMNFQAAPSSKRTYSIPGSTPRGSFVDHATPRDLIGHQSHHGLHRQQRTKTKHKESRVRPSLRPVDLARLYELYERNLMQPQSLRSCYPVELQLFDDCELLELAGRLLEECAATLTPRSREEVQRVLEGVLATTNTNDRDFT